MSDEPIRHIDKTRQDKLPVEYRVRVAQAIERRNAMGDHVDAARRVAIQVPRLMRGRYDLRHLNAYIGYRHVLA